MKHFDWNNEKNQLLIDTRGVSFEEVVLAIESGDLLDRVKHPNVTKHPNQMVFFVSINKYVYAVPFVEDDEKIFLKTIIPDRKATMKYLGGSSNE